MKQVVFDFGGVLMNWDPTLVYSDVFEDRKELNYFFQHVCNHAWNAKQDAGRSFDEATKTLQAKYPKYHDEIALYYGRWQEMITGPITKNVELLPKLKKNTKLFGLTNWSAESFPIVYEENPFFGLFDGIVVSGEEGFIKPGPEIFEILITRFDIDPKESIFIDDSSKNIETAEALGFETIHYAPETDLEAELKEKGVL